MLSQSRQGCDIYVADFMYFDSCITILTVESPSSAFRHTECCCYASVSQEHPEASLRELRICSLFRFILN